MKVLFISTGVEEPASRFRVLQFLPHFERMGIECTSFSGYGASYNRIAQTPVGPLYKLYCRGTRALRTLAVGGYDAVFLQRTALPTSALVERIAARRNPRIIFDFDDSIFLEPGPRGRPNGPRSVAFHQAIAASARVVAGNAFLAAAAGAPDKTIVIPTVVDTDRYTPEAPGGRRSGPVVIGWMGTSSNFPYLEEIVPAVRQLLDEQPGLVFRIVSNAPFQPLAGHPRVEQVPWSEETELASLRGFDIGVMPLEDTDVARGKCGFKMIQYMSVGTPVVSSAVGANVEILAGSGAGELVSPAGDWVTPLRALALNPERRHAMALAARRRIVQAYSVESVLGRYASLFESVARGGGR